MFEPHTESTFAALQDILTTKYGPEYWKSDTRKRHKKRQKQKRRDR